MDKLSKLVAIISKSNKKQIINGASRQPASHFMNKNANSLKFMMQNLITVQQNSVMRQQFSFFKPSTFMSFSSAQDTQNANLEELKKKEASLLNGLKKDKSQVDSLVEHAESYLEFDGVEECVNLYKAALEINPESSRLNCKLGTLLVQLEELEEGVKYIEKGLAIDHAEMGEEGIIGLASVYKMLNQNEKAIQTYQKSIELNYLPSYSHQFIALLYAEQRDFERADQHYKTSLALNPNDFLSQWAYGEIVFAKNQEDGIKIMKEAAEGIATKTCQNKFVQQEEIDEMIQNMNYRVGQILQHLQKDIEGAKQYYKLVLKNNPNHVESHVQYATCLKKGENPNNELAEYHIKKAKEIDPSKFEKKLTEWW